MAAPVVRDVKAIEHIFKTSTSVAEVQKLPVEKRQKREKVKEIIWSKSATLVDKVLDYYDDKKFVEMEDRDVLRLLDTLTRNALQEAKSETTVNVFGDDMAKIIMQAQAEAIERAKKEQAIPAKCEVVDDGKPAA